MTALLILAGPILVVPLAWVIGIVLFVSARKRIRGDNGARRKQLLRAAIVLPLYVVLSALVVLGVDLILQILAQTAPDGHTVVMLGWLFGLAVYVAICVMMGLSFQVPPSRDEDSQ